jgi:SAM-dependent methyltransferase
MNQALREESGKLARSWMRHEAAWLKDYLVASVEDPRRNLQSILTRHFLATALTGDRFVALMQQEYRFAAAMNWLIPLIQRGAVPDDSAAVLYALRRRADNAEGIALPAHILQTFAALPSVAGALNIPNYIEDFFSIQASETGERDPVNAALDLFQSLWSTALSRFTHHSSLSVLEPACGSANDYRFLQSCGLAPLLDYTGFDICSKNVENARALFPGTRFEVGNVFALNAANKAFDLCFVHDLFEHLSLEGLETAVAEICRVTRQGICAGFFNMDEMPGHIVTPFEEYHWNTLSMSRMKGLFAEHGFVAQVVHIGTFLRQQVGCDKTHNPNAYTFLLARS